MDAHGLGDVLARLRNANDVELCLLQYFSVDGGNGAMTRTSIGIGTLHCMLKLKTY